MAKAEKKFWHFGYPLILQKNIQESLVQSVPILNYIHLDISHVMCFPLAHNYGRGQREGLGSNDVSDIALTSYLRQLFNWRLVTWSLCTCDNNTIIVTLLFTPKRTSQQ
jgi:hypothetical protein